MTSSVRIKNALVSVYDKSHLLPLCKSLASRGVRIFSTGGTAEFLSKEGRMGVVKIETLTGAPEILDGRVKTLHPKVFGGILARRNHPADLEQVAQYDLTLFDLVVVNLYPFWEKLGQEVQEQSALIDIGGPSMLRAAAKNFQSVAVLSDCSNYEPFLDDFEKNQGCVSFELRKNLAAETFRRTSQYDALIAREWGNEGAFPTQISLVPQTQLRYGENPHQNAVWAGDGSRWKCLQGKELSFNNLLDLDATIRMTSEFALPAVSIVKHGNPCGVASADALPVRLFEKALACDPKSAFGGIVSSNREIDAAAAEKMAAIFLEAIHAPKFTTEALAILEKKKNLRLVEWKAPRLAKHDIRPAMGGWLIQQPDNRPLNTEQWKVVTKKTVSPELQEELLFAWRVVKHVRSNAIVVSEGGRTLGVGCGQTNRVGSVDLALKQFKTSGVAQGVLASDAFFPFRDSVEALKDSGICAVVQPGGAQRDAEVIAACDEMGIAMVFTGERHFRH